MQRERERERKNEREMKRQRDTRTIIITITIIIILYKSCSAHRKFMLSANMKSEKRNVWHTHYIHIENDLNQQFKH